MTSAVAAGQTATDEIKADPQAVSPTRLCLLQGFLLVGTVHEHSGIVSEILGSIDRGTYIIEMFHFS